MQSQKLVKGTTPEVATLRFLQGKESCFQVPKIPHNFEHNGSSYLFISRLPGHTLGAAWADLNDEWRRHYVNEVVEVYKALETWKGKDISGVNGKFVPDEYLIKMGAMMDFSPENLENGCKAIGMDCSNLVFYHADLGPGNIIVEEDPEQGAIGIIDWECAGYFPRGCIRTKFRIPSRLDLPDGDEPHLFRAEVQRALGKSGFEEYAEAWQSWWLTS